MAETLDGLFGPSAYDVEQARNKQALDYAAQVAAMNNLQQAKLGIGQGAAGITRGAAGMFGLVDPKVEQAKMREGVMGMGGDLSTSAGLKAKAAQFAAAGDQATAMKLLMVAKRQEADEAKVKLADAAEKRKEYAAMPDMEKYAISMAKRSGLKEWTPEFDEFVSVFMYEQKNKEKQPQDPTSYREWVLAGKPNTYAEWLTSQKKAGAPNVTNVMPGAKDLKDIPKFRKNVQDTVKPQLETIYASDKALSALDLAIKQNNPSAFQVARTQLAKAAGDSQISLREIEAAGGDPSLFGKLIDTTSVLFTGTPSLETQMAMKRTIQAMKSIAKQKGKSEIDVQRALAKQSNYTDEQIGAALKFDQFEDKEVGAGQTVTLKSGKTVKRVD